VRRINLRPIDIALEHDGRAGEGKQKAEEDRLIKRAPEQIGCSGDQKKGENNLQASSE
jgi:hypothetical protein